MSFDVRISGEHAKIVLSGDVDLQTTADLKSEIQNISGVARLEIEAGDVTYIDSSGVAVLLLARQHCAQNNIALSLPTISDAVFRVLQIAKLDVMLPIGQVLNSSDAGLMGLGSSEGAAP
ncbi:MAG: STAS domain-containing protein, partial [Candidatus Puniceispirillaceae bacterium]